ncbi:MAG TPA: SMP-30/gluconolactonase/LRE family protein [Burkholderiales bacterium]
MNAEPFGRDLHRPECVHCTAQGDVFVSDWRGGVTRIRSDGSQQLFKGDRAVKTNGFAILPDRSFLLAHLGDDDGGVFRLASDGALSVFLDDLPPTNFVHAHGDTVYVTVSTRLVPRTLARKPGYADGFIVCVDRRGTRVVAEGLGYTNECKVDPTRKWLYVNETFGKRLSRFALRPDGDLGARETVAEFGAGTFPDGLDYDAEGGVWITSVFSNRLIRIAPGGEQRVLLEDNDSRFVARIEEQFARGELVRDVHPEVPAKLIRNLSSSAFGGEDLRTLYLGCLQDSRIYRMPSPVAGARPPHWDVRFP